jgi:methyl-accepting chemotaxis protein
MKWWDDLKVRTKVMTLVVGGCSGLLVVSLIGLGNMKKGSADLLQATTMLAEVANAEELKNEFLLMRLNLVYMLALEDKAKLEEKFQGFEKAVATLKEGVAAYEKKGLDARERELSKEFSAGFAAYLVQGKKLAEMERSAVAAGNTQARAEALKFALESVGPLYAKPAQAVNDLVRYNIESEKKTYLAAEAAYQSSFAIMIAVLLGIMAFATAAGIFIANSIRGPLKRIFDTLALFAAGDLTARSEITTRDEMGMLALEINLMGKNLQSTIAEVAQQSVQVATTASQLYATAEQMATGSEEVAAQAETVATAGEEMAATSGEIAQNCQMAAGSAQKANDAALAGAGVVEATVSVMGRIAERVSVSAKTVGSLGVRSEQIGAIIGTIEDIADQTNLLALNAAIEAARAGEQGRGFAVVADEVRALAERTTRATREIGEMIKAIQQETKGAVQAMEEGVREVESGTAEAAKSGQALQEILEQINAVSMQVSQVATAAEEQTATTSEISGNIHQITQVAQQTARGAQESAGAASQLAGVAENMKRLLSAFKIDGTNR